MSLPDVSSKRANDPKTTTLVSDAVTSFTASVKTSIFCAAFWAARRRFLQSAPSSSSNLEIADKKKPHASFSWNDQNISTKSFFEICIRDKSDSGSSRMESSLSRDPTHRARPQLARFPCQILHAVPNRTCAGQGTTETQPAEDGVLRCGS